jgi:hypothetical protein
MWVVQEFERLDRNHDTVKRFPTNTGVIDIRNSQGHLGVRTCPPAAGLGDREQRAFAGSVVRAARLRGAAKCPWSPVTFVPVHWSGSAPGSAQAEGRVSVGDQ